MSSVIITVVVVLGIIVAGGFLLYFMGDLFMSLSHKKKDEDAINKKQAEETEELKKRIDALEKSDELKKDPEVATILYNGAVVENYNPNEDEQEVEEEPEEQIEEPETVEEEAEEPAQEEEPAEETEEEDDTADFMKRKRQLILPRSNQKRLLSKIQKRLMLKSNQLFQPQQRKRLSKLKQMSTLLQTL